MKKIILLFAAAIAALTNVHAIDVVTVEITRAANTTPYVVHGVIADAVNGSAIRLADVASAPGRSGYLVKARFTTDQKTFTARLQTHIYKEAPAALADNTPLPFLYVNAAIRVGYFDFAAAVNLGDATTSTAATSLRDDLRMRDTPRNDSRDLWIRLKTLDAFTPASGQKFFIELSFDNEN